MPVYQLRVAAPQMRARAAVMRTSFVDEYLTPENPYPFEVIFRSAAFRPTSDAALKRLLSRGAFQIAGGVLSNSGAAVDAPFLAQLDGQDLRLTVTVPADARIDVRQSEDRITLEPAGGWLVVFVDRPVVGGLELPIAQRQRIQSITVSDDALEYVLVSETEAAEDFVVTVDFGVAQDAPFIRMAALTNDSVSCTCCMTPVASAGWYILQTPTGCVVEYFEKDDKVKTQLVVEGPFQARDQAEARIAELIKAGKCTGGQ